MFRSIGTFTNNIFRCIMPSRRAAPASAAEPSEQLNDIFDSKSGISNGDAVYVSSLFSSSNSTNTHLALLGWCRAITSMCPAAYFFFLLLDTNAFMFSDSAPTPTQQFGPCSPTRTVRSS